MVGALDHGLFSSMNMRETAFRINKHVALIAQRHSAGEAYGIRAFFHCLSAARHALQVIVFLESQRLFEHEFHPFDVDVIVTNKRHFVKGQLTFVANLFCFVYRFCK